MQPITDDDMSTEPPAKRWYRITIDGETCGHEWATDEGAATRRALHFSPQWKTRNIKAHPLA